MSKYEPLGTYLREQGTELVRMTFAQIERVVGTKLPKSRQHPAWWSNSTSNNVMTQVWLDAGYRTEQIDVAHERLVFRRVAGAVPPPQGFSDTARNFEQEGAVKKPRRHPAWGALKGTFTIAPGYDLTSPVYSDEEWAEIEKEMEADWDQIEQGMRGQK